MDYNLKRVDGEDQDQYFYRICTMKDSLGFTWPQIASIMNDELGVDCGEFASLTAFSSNVLVLLPIMMLVVIGGIGFVVLFDIFAGFVCAGIPFGWKWASKLFVAISLHTFIFKVILSILLGWIALPVVIL
jgi:Trk-type K+ transport system membrane component